jgi:hypothetical protein
VIISNIIQIEDIIIGREIVKSEFACDLKKCKGACCTIYSDFGAPLLEDEIIQIQDVLDSVKEYLSEYHIEEIQNNGFFERKQSELMIRSVDNKACIFVFYENEIAKCSIEKAFLDGKINFRKPVSCHLFPIRISDFGGDVLRFEKFEECSPALQKGKSESIKLIDFLKDSLIRKYGEKWYLKLKVYSEGSNVNA